MGCQIDVDGAEGTRLSLVMRQAKKPHKCIECRKEINPGESYEYQAGLLDGDFWTMKSCAVCAEIRTELFCTWIGGEMWEELREHSVWTLSLANLSEAAIDRLQEFWKANQ